LSPYLWVTEPEWVLSRMDEGKAFFKVWAIYQSANPHLRRSRDVRRDGTPILTFEEENNFNLISYSPAEDRHPDRWEITDREAFGGEGHSLRLYGNTWKRLLVPRLVLTDSTVWQIAILSVDGDTSAEIQGFGVSDGVRELIYTFYGRETNWDHSWMIANQEARPRGRWQLFRLSVGYDWTIRYGTRPSITQFLFINDNDTTNPPAQIYYDEITDITSDLPIQPRVRFRWWREGINEVQGEIIGFQALAEPWEWDGYRFLWDFGDGFQGEGNPMRHIYSMPGEYSVGLKVLGPANRLAYALSRVTIGAIVPLQRARIAFVGDVMLARRYEEPGGIINRNGPEAVFARIRDKTLSADIFVINLESPLTDEGTPHPTKDIVFRGRPDNVAGLAFAGVDVATLANNHILDFGERGLEETMEVLESANIRFTGAGRDEYEALQPAFITVNGIRIGFLAFSNRTGRDYNARPYLDAGFDKAGYAYFSADNLIRSVPPTKAVSDFLVVAVHGGWEYADHPSSMLPESEYPPWSEERVVYSPSVDSATQALEHLAIDLGADLIVAHHPHVLQGWESYRGALIAHSLGNFAFDQNFWETWPSAIWWVTVGRDGILYSEIEPIFIDNYLPTPTQGELREKILRRIADYSLPMNVVVVPSPEERSGIIVDDLSQIRLLRQDHRIATNLRYIPPDEVYRSPPVRVEGEGFLSHILRISPEAQEPRWRVRWGREMLLVGNFEREGAELWNWNSAYEGRDSGTVRSGRFSAFLRRNAGQQDVVTDLIQRIPINPQYDLITFGGWVKSQNGRQSALAIRCYRFRYDSRPQNILGDLIVEGRWDGDRDWTYMWQDLVLPPQTYFINPRWQLYGPVNGIGWMWVDDLELIRWGEWIDLPLEGIAIDFPNDFYYIQIETSMPRHQAEINYQTCIFTWEE
ncbi:MAG: CapA family protein, partial [bacterium]